MGRINRRNFMACLLSGSAGALIDKMAGGIIEGWAYDRFNGLVSLVSSRLPRLDPFPDEFLRSYRNGFLQERILTAGGLRLSVAGDLNERLGQSSVGQWSHDALALAPLQRYGIAHQLAAPTWLMTAAPTDGVISTGSPVASDLTGNYLPVFDLGDDPSPLRQLAVNPDRLRYHFVTGVEGAAKVVSASQGGKVAYKRNNGVRDTALGAIRHPIPSVDEQGFLASDYLILQRIPRNELGGEILLVAGLHGPATQAFELLFDRVAFPDSELEYLEAAVGAEPYFQAVLEASDIVHSPPMSVARRLRVSRLMPPQKVLVTPDFFA